MGDMNEWTSSVVAFNTATASTNRMHDDTVAASYGFRGGLVPGVDVWAYATGPCVDRWGREFLEHGTIELGFDAPVYDGERVLATLDEAGRITVCCPDGDVRAQGTAALAEVPVEPKDLPSADLPTEPPPAAVPELLVPGTALGSLRFHHRAEPHAAYLDDVRESRDLYEGGAVCHPGFLARQANYVLAQTVTLGPWIHVHTRAQHRRIVRDGDAVDVRGRVTNEWERRGHRFVELDVEVTADDEPAWSATHTAIWRPRSND